MFIVNVGYLSTRGNNFVLCVQYFRNSLRPISAQSRISSQRSMQSGNAGNSAGPAGARPGATLSSTTGSDWSSSVDSRPPRGGPSKSNRNQKGQHNNQVQRQQQPPSSNNNRQVRIDLNCSCKGWQVEYQFEFSAFTLKKRFLNLAYVFTSSMNVSASYSECLHYLFYWCFARVKMNLDLLSLKLCE